MEPSYFTEHVEGATGLKEKYGYAIPTARAIRAIAAHAPIVEVGAGAGYWSWLISMTGAQIVSTDKTPWPSVFTCVEVEDYQKTLARFPQWTLLLIYEWTDPAEIIKSYKGDTLIRIGPRPIEPIDFKEIERIPIPESLVQIFKRIK